LAATDDRATFAGPKTVFSTFCVRTHFEFFFDVCAPHHEADGRRVNDTS
jgi:hypothetical protein